MGIKNGVNHVMSSQSPDLDLWEILKIMFILPIQCQYNPVYPLCWIDLPKTSLNQSLVSFLFFSLFIPFIDGQQIWELEATVDKDKSQTVSTVKYMLIFINIKPHNWLMPAP